MSALRFDGQVAIVTGAGRGLGRAHALALAERGASVVVNDLGSGLAGRGEDGGPAAEVVAEIVARGGSAVADGGDVADPVAADALVARAVEAFGRLDVVVNNAGNLAVGSIEDLTREALQRHLDVHVNGSFEVTRAAWPHLVAQGYGRVVLTTSIGLFGAAHLLAYSAAKGATASLGRALAEAGAPHGIRVNLLAPNAETRMVTDPAFRIQCGLPPLDADAAPDPLRAAETVTPMLVVLAHETCPVSGEILTAGAGRFTRLFFAQTPGVVAHGLDAEGVLARWGEIVAEPGYVVPATTADAVRLREAAIAAAAPRE